MLKEVYPSDYTVEFYLMKGLHDDKLQHLGHWPIFSNIIHLDV